MNLEIDHRQWPFGTELAEELLTSISLLAKSRAGSRSMERIDNRDFKIYWAGSVLRIDIPEATVDWNV